MVWGVRLWDYLLGLGEVSPMLLELSEAGDVIFEIVAIEGDMAIDTDKGRRSASTKSMLFCLFLLQGCIAIAADESNHIVEIFLLLKGNIGVQY